MSQPNIITGQYVQISQSPASVGERLVAQLADWLLEAGYLYVAFRFMSFVNEVFSETWEEWVRIVIFLVVVLFPVWLYCPLCELFNNGQTLGKKLLKMRVVKVDGSSPTLSSALLRWLLFIFEGLSFTGVGVLVMLFNRNNQRLGDLAAGTMVIKIDSYSRIQVSLDDFDHLSRSYQPTYPHAADLTLEQMELITTTHDLPEDDPRVHALAEKVQQTLGITTVKESSDSSFLYRIIKDYQYFALEEI